jgi:hypothetical protein
VERTAPSSNMHLFYTRRVNYIHNSKNNYYIFSMLNCYTCCTSVYILQVICISCIHTHSHAPCVSLWVYRVTVHCLQIIGVPHNNSYTPLLEHISLFRTTADVGTLDLLSYIWQHYFCHPLILFLVPYLLFRMWLYSTTVFTKSVHSQSSNCS